MPKCHVTKKWLRYTQGFQPRALDAMKFDGHRISDITTLLSLFCYLWLKKGDFEIALMMYISSYEELQLEFGNIFVHRLGRKTLGSDKSVWNIWGNTTHIKKTVSSTLKINGKNSLTLSHILTFLGSKNDTTAKYKEGFKNFFWTFFLLQPRIPILTKN